MAGREVSILAIFVRHFPCYCVGVIKLEVEVLKGCDMWWLSDWLMCTRESYLELFDLALDGLDVSAELQALELVQFLLRLSQPGPDVVQV